MFVESANVELLLSDVWHLLRQWNHSSVSQIIAISRRLNFFSNMYKNFILHQYNVFLGSN